MSFFISDAMAEGEAAVGAAGSSGAESFMGLIPLVVVFIIFYFLLMRPQIKRAKEHKKLTESVNKGDEVSTSGGILGKVVDVNDNFVTMEIADNVKVKVQRQSIATLLPKGTI